MNKTTLLEVTELCIGYDGKSIFDDICFSITTGSYLCVVGENGTGKSTLLKTISGLLKPIFGRVEFSVARREIGYLPQQTAVQHDFPASAREIVSSGALSRGKWYRPFLSKEERKQIAWACEKTGVTSFEEQCFRELSGGQQQRVLLARALVTATNAVIMDEPTAGLDPEATKEFNELLTRLNRDEEITIIMVTHDVESAVENASHILHLYPNNSGSDEEESEDFFFGEVGKYREKTPMAQKNLNRKGGVCNERS